MKNFPSHGDPQPSWGDPRPWVSRHGDQQPGCGSPPMVVISYYCHFESRVSHVTHFLLDLTENLNIVG